MKRRILLTTTRSNSTRVIMESLGKRGHEIFLADPNPNAVCFSSKYCTKHFVCPNEEDKKNYINFILDILKKEHIDLLIPTSDYGIEYFSEIREQILKYTHIVLTDKETIDVARNKNKTYRYCQKYGFPIPLTFFPSTLEDVKFIADQLSYPCLAKFAKGTADEGNVYFQKKEWLISFYRNLMGQTEWPVIQEFVYGDVVCFFAVCKEGEILAQHTQLVAYKHSKGAAAVAYIYTNPHFSALIKQIIKQLNWTGAISIDFIKEKDEKFKLLEINPRFGASTTFAYKLGIDLPFVFYCLAFDETLPSFNNNNENGRMLRHLFPTELVYCIKDRGHIPALFKNFFVPKTIIDINWRDPALAIAMIKHSFVSIKAEFALRLQEKLKTTRETKNKKDDK